MNRRIAIFALAALASPVLAQHDHSSHQMQASSMPFGEEWTHQPLLLPRPMRNGSRNAAVLRPRGLDVSEVVVYASGGPPEKRQVAYPVTLEGAAIATAGPMVGNYHWVVARQEDENEVRVASTVWYFSNPGPAPTEMLLMPKHELEIVPQPLPREHGSYRESEKWSFLIRWQGQPLANQALTLETDSGTRTRTTTGADGIATVLFPRDIAPAGGDAGEHAGHGPRRVKFVLSTERNAEGKRYLTAFNTTYSPDPDRERSLGWGAAFGLIGMVAALPLLRRRTATADFSENKNA